MSSRRHELGSETHNIYLSTQCFRKAVLMVHSARYDKMSTVKVLKLFSSVSDEDVARVANVKG